MSVCVVCNKKALYFCGHGCETTYCGKECAESVYPIHTQMDCYGLIGLEDTQTIIRRVSGGSPAQVYANFYKFYESLKQEFDQYSRMNWLQKRIHKSNMEKSSNNFLEAAHYLIANRPDFDGDTRQNIQKLWNWVKEYTPLYLSAEIGEGVVDFHKDSSDYFRNMNLNNASHREVVIKRIFDDVEASFEEGSKKRLGKSGLAKKLGYFSKALTDLIAQRKDLTSSERQTYSQYVQQVDAWIVLLKK
jgi:hypothetical protein